MNDLYTLHMDRAPYGIRYYQQGNYGTIALRMISKKVAHRVTGTKSDRYYYLLTGAHNRSGRFPGVQKWSDAIYAANIGKWDPKNMGWKIPLTNKERADEVNAVLAPILVESIRVYSKVKREKRKAYFGHHPELLRGGGVS